MRTLLLLTVALSLAGQAVAAEIVQNYSSNASNSTFGIGLLNLPPGQEVTQIDIEYSFDYSGQVTGLNQFESGLVTVTVDGLLEFDVPGLDFDESFQDQVSVFLDGIFIWTFPFEGRTISGNATLLPGDAGFSDYLDNTPDQLTLGWTLSDSSDPPAPDWTQELEYQYDNHVTIRYTVIPEPATLCLAVLAIFLRRSD